MLDIYTYTRILVYSYTYIYIRPSYTHTHSNRSPYSIFFYIYIYLYWFIVFTPYPIIGCSDFMDAVLGMCTNTTSCREGLEDVAKGNLDGFFAKTSAGGLDWWKQEAVDLWTTSVNKLGHYSFCLNDPQHKNINGKVKATMELADIAPFQFESVCKGPESGSGSSSSSSSSSSSGTSDGKSNNSKKGKKKQGHAGAIAAGVIVSLLLVAGAALLLVRHRRMAAGTDRSGSQNVSDGGELGGAEYTAMEE